MVFQLARTYDDPGVAQNAQRGFPAPGAGEQTTGPYSPQPLPTQQKPLRPTKGRASLFMRRNAGQQRGFAEPLSAEEMRPLGSMPNNPPVYGRNIEVYTEPYSRGAAAYVQNYGKVLYNPIGAGIVALNRPQASYGPAAQYFDKAIWWTSQAIPTSVNLQGLTSPQVLADMLSSVEVQAVVRVG